MTAGDGTSRGEDVPRTDARGSAAMDHDFIDRNQVVERYLQGRLGDEELEAFEEHYVTCGRCLEQLETTERLRKALGGVAAEDAVASRLGLLAAITRFVGSRAALGLLIVLALLPSFLLLRSNRQLEDALAAARTVEVNPLLLHLSPSRSLVAEPDAHLHLGGTARVVLALDLDPATRGPFEARLLGPTGRELWHGSGLDPGPGGALVLSLPVKLFEAGDHRLEVSDPGESRLVFRLRVAHD